MPLKHALFFFKNGNSKLPISFADSFFSINGDVKPLQNIGHSNSYTVSRHRFDLAAVLVKFLLKIIDAADRFVQFLLHRFGIRFAALQQVNDLLKFVLYLIYQKIRIV